MGQKYGKFGDEDAGWSFYCVEFDTKAEWHEINE